MPIGYFIPRALAARITELPQGIRFTKKTLNVLAYGDGINIPGVRVRGRRPLVERFLKDHELSPMGDGLVNDHMHRIYGCGASVVIDGEHKKLKAEKEIRAGLEETLTILSSYTGLEFHLHYDDDCCLPFGADDKNVHFVLGASPPGDVQNLERSHLLGVTLHYAARDITHYGPAKGYGVCIQDDKKEIVAQIIHSTIYLFLPLDDIRLLERSGANLFGRAVQVAWNAYGEDEAKGAKEGTTVDGRNAYRRQMERWAEGRAKMTDFSIELVNHEIKRVQDELRELFGKKRTLIAFQRGRKDLKGSERQRRAQLRQQWERLMAIPLIEHVVFSEGAFQIKTKTVIVEDEGARYRTGSYMIRIDAFGNVSIWAHAPTHPKRIPHPHISRKGVWCFGNYTTPIEEAAMAMDIGETAHLITRWLVEGYDPSVADTRIEEWPVVIDQIPTIEAQPLTEKESVHGGSQLLTPVESV